jgi:hypothetical protein
MMLRFQGRDSFGHRERHEKDMIAFLSKRTQTMEYIDGDAVDLDGMWKKLWLKAQQIFPQGNSGIRVLVDLSTCPRYYTLGFIAALVQYGVAEQITVFYAEGNYSEDMSTHPIVYPFTIGQWKAVAIPFLQGFPDPLKKKYFLVSVGFEGTKTGRVLAKEDPDRVSILFPDPGARAGYVKQTLERNLEIFKQFKIPEKQIFRVSSGDAIDVWKKLSLHNPERFAEESAYYLCCGTKAHALGLALRALCLQHPTVLYNLPEKHNFIDVYPSGTYWAFAIQDVSVPRRSHKTDDHLVVS